MLTIITITFPPKSRAQVVVLRRQWSRKDIHPKILTGVVSITVAWWVHIALGTSRKTRSK
ncbi:hypothetical protein K443DRAFT_341737 [Laccaria amethystina LaAM-08-1]|uniref:Uncharacterized protein n=1 Tax=Laccaria amethystina LaAM-08-1 TaxID=1095629 RepID=A0A0C9X0V4_9AGAR|nr:hypothetical protein K443DRAFT_341737 [Laccaria amethystina LaAM-08-1]